MGINKVILVGNVGRDPEFRALPSGTNLAKFTLATSEPRFKDPSGTPHTEWHNIVVWGRLAEICNQYVRKGRQLYIEGRIRRHEYEKGGQRMYFTEIHADNFELLGSRSHREIPSLLRDSQVFLLPSVRSAAGDEEGTPVSLMEAMATGLPVVSTVHAGIPELVEEGVSGFLVPERDEEGVTYHRRERPVGSFSRVVPLPVEVDAGKVAAELSGGVLWVTLPKAPSAKPRKINVSVAE